VCACSALSERADGCAELASVVTSGQAPAAKRAEAAVPFGVTLVTLCSWNRSIRLFPSGLMGFCVQERLVLRSKTGLCTVDPSPRERVATRDARPSISSENTALRAAHLPSCL
jgi:hypothetical protein